MENTDKPRFELYGETRKHPHKTICLSCEEADGKVNWEVNTRTYRQVTFLNHVKKTRSVQDVPNHDCKMCPPSLVKISFKIEDLLNQTE